MLVTPFIGGWLDHSLAAALSCWPPKRRPEYPATCRHRASHDWARVWAIWMLLRSAPSTNPEHPAFSTVLLALICLSFPFLVHVLMVRKRRAWLYSFRKEWCIEQPHISHADNPSSIKSTSTTSNKLVDFCYISLLNEMHVQFICSASWNTAFAITLGSFWVFFTAVSWKLEIW